MQGGNGEREKGQLTRILPEESYEPVGNNLLWVFRREGTVFLIRIMVVNV